jgi:hypothetical protein
MYSTASRKEPIFCLKVEKFDHTRDGDSVEVHIHAPAPRPSIIINKNIAIEYGFS